MTQFSLTQANFLDYYSDKPREFVICISDFAKQMSSGYGCDVKVSADKLLTAHDFWIGDVNRTAKRGHSQIDRFTGEEFYKKPNHLKQLAFLTFWIRRASPISDIVEKAGHNVLPLNVNRFFAYSNELLAFHAGIKICFGYEVREIRSHQQDSKSIHTWDAIKTGQALHSKLKNWSFVSDYVITLKHKNMSPHAIYLIYRTLFSDRR